MSLEDLKQIVPELREKSRQQYLKHREEQVMDLYRQNL